MPDQTSNGMQCHEFYGLLSDAVDRVLTGLQLDRFQAHARTCSVCGPLFAEVEAGRNWLKDLTEVEPPVSLVNNILASTTGVDTQRLRVNVTAPQPRSSRLGASWWERAQAWASGAMEPIWGTVRQPRFAMSFGMAFFSLSISLSLAGVKVSDVRHVDLRPSSIKRTYYETSGRVVKYYENIRFVYEIESRMRELKRVTAPAETSPKEQKKEQKNNNTSGEPEQNQERNYSQGENQPVLASIPNDPPVETVTTYRRIS